MDAATSSGHDGDSEMFLNHCKGIFDTCTRLLLSDQVSTTNLTYVYSKLDMLDTSIQRAGEGNLISAQLSEDLRLSVSELREYARGKDSRSDTYQGEHQQRALTIPKEATPGRGAPRYVLTEGMLSALTECKFTAKRMASVLGVSLRTIRRRLRDFELCKKDLQSNLTDDELDSQITTLIAGNRLLGPNMVKAKLEAIGIQVKRQRVRQAMVRVDPGGAALRAVRTNVHQRRQYAVAGPNSLWHFDGNHKLIRWHIVIHGCIDGYSRLMTFLTASNNNRASTVLDLFIDAVVQYGVPSRVRCDHGGENVDVCSFMEIYRGAGRGSAIRGRSVHNQRIERFWVDLWKGCTHKYYSLFQFLEEEGVLHPDNPCHLWCLQYVFLPRLNQDLSLFAAQWNLHGVRTVKGSLAPETMYMEGMLRLHGSDHTAALDLLADNEPESVDDTYGLEPEVPAVGEATTGAEVTTNGLEPEVSAVGEATTGATGENRAGAPIMPTADHPEPARFSIVDVPSVSCPFSNAQLQQLTHDVNPLDNSLDIHGIGLYQKTLSYLE